jgi:hypothetical protein
MGRKNERSAGNRVTIGCSGRKIKRTIVPYFQQLGGDENEKERGERLKDTDKALLLLVPTVTSRQLVDRLTPWPGLQFEGFTFGPNWHGSARLTRSKRHSND